MLRRLLETSDIRAIQIWYKDRSRWKCGLSQEGPSQPPPEAQHWRESGLQIQVAPADQAHLPRMRRVLWKRLKRGEDRLARRRMLFLLQLQRQALGHVLHRGVCQGMTVMDLQCGWIEMCTTDSEKEEARQELSALIQSTSRDVRTFYEGYLLGRSPGNWPFPDWLRSDQKDWLLALGRIWQMYDPELTVTAQDQVLEFHFRQPPNPKILKALGWVGLKSKHSDGSVGLVRS